MQKLPIAIGRIGCDGGGLPSLPLDKAGKHVLRGHRLGANRMFNDPQPAFDDVQTQIIEIDDLRFVNRLA
jgi:hypothetical protein